MGAARDLRGAARHAAYTAGQAGAVAHVAAHELGAAAYAIKAARAAAPDSLARHDRQIADIVRGPGLATTVMMSRSAPASVPRENVSPYLATVRSADSALGDADR
jgi:hypothetical protein